MIRRCQRLSPERVGAPLGDGGDRLDDRGVRRGPHGPRGVRRLRDGDGGVDDLEDVGIAGGGELDGAHGRAQSYQAWRSPQCGQPTDVDTDAVKAVPQAHW